MQRVTEQLRAIDRLGLPADAHHQHHQFRRKIIGVAGDTASPQAIAVEARQQRDAAGAILATGGDHRIAGGIKIAQRTAPAGVNVHLGLTVVVMVEQMPEVFIILCRRHVRHHVLTSVGALFIL